MYRLAMVCVSCALALTACSKPEEGSKLPPLASASPSASPSPSKSAAPVDDKAAIVALARTYYLARNLAVETGNTTRVRALATPNCPCNAFLNQIDADWRRGRVECPNYYVIVDVRSPFFRNTDAGVVTVFYRTNAYLVVNASGEMLSSSAADLKTRSARVDLRRIQGQWKVSDVVRL